MNKCLLNGQKHQMTELVLFHLYDSQRAGNKKLSKCVNWLQNSTDLLVLDVDWLLLHVGAVVDLEDLPGHADDVDDGADDRDNPQDLS